jgi:hypothetical protein
MDIDNIRNEALIDQDIIKRIGKCFCIKLKNFDTLKKTNKRNPLPECRDTLQGENLYQIFI